jgi:predicted dienelactone hydrolase
MIQSIVLVVAMCFAIPAAQGKEPYDPLSAATTVTPEILNFEVHDEARQRDIPIRVYLPGGESPAPVILFSHGLGGSRETSPYLGKHWSARGYVAVFLQHPGSDESIWKGKSAKGKKAGMHSQGGCI